MNQSTLLHSTEPPESHGVKPDCTVHQPGYRTAGCRQHRDVDDRVALAPCRPQHLCRKADASGFLDIQTLSEHSSSQTFCQQQEAESPDGPQNDTTACMPRMAAGVCWQLTCTATPSDAWAACSAASCLACQARATMCCMRLVG